MQENTSRTIPVIIGFFLCLMMMVAITTIAFHLLKRNMEVAMELQNTNDMHVSLVQSFRQFDAAQIAMLRFRETNDQQFAQEVANLLRK